jgi:chromosomal replication initiation ATPase DnaA
MLDGRLRFDTFVTGPSNRLAVSAARAVAEAPGKVYHPLFLYAEPGLGKTHLLAALGFHAVQIDPALTAEYRTAEDYAAQLRAASERGDLNAWRREWESIRLLLLDDVQFLDGATEAQAELLRLIDQAQGRGFQVVLASDRPPADLDGLDQRLLSRMSGGLIADIATPELETRLGILWLWRSVHAVDVDDAALDELARPEVENVRELLGLFNRLVAQRSLEPGTPAAGVARQVVAQAGEERAAPPDEFESFLSEVAAVVTSSVEQWRARLASTVARWAGEGYSTEMLEQFLDGIEPPDLDAVEARFAAAVNQLRDLEQEAARLDPRLAGVPVFRDPGRLEEARSIVMRALAAYDPPPAPAEHLTISAFSSGARNQLALRAAGEVIALPGSRYNPLYIHGPQSSGKTHLSHAIANALVARDGGAWTVAVVDGAAFGDELIEALRTGSLERWRMRYRAVDGIVVDNVQRIGGSDRLQDEFFHLFNTFIETGRQVVLTADAPPSRLTAMATRLQSRFEAGLVVEIGRVSEEEAVARDTPVPDGAEAAAPTIDAWFEDVIDPDVARPAFMEPSSAVDSFFLDPEKVVTDWPGLDGRVIEDPR